MGYGIYFDESNKLDQPKGNYSYYGALGISVSTSNKIIEDIRHLNEQLNTKSEMHFVDYTSDSDFEKYFRTLNYILRRRY